MVLLFDLDVGSRLRGLCGGKALYGLLASVWRGAMYFLCSLSLALILLYSLTLIALLALLRRCPFQWGTLSSLFTNMFRGHPTEADLRVPQLAAHHGFACEEHVATTTDGFSLTMHRLCLPGADLTDVDNAAASPKPAILLHHGLMQSSAVWLMNSRHNSLPFVLVDAGFDVWLGNNRGNSYTHSRYFPAENPKAWDWTFAEMGEFDLNAEISYILSHTKCPKLTYIGHSQGSTQAFAGLSLTPGLGDKMNLFVALSPAVFLKCPSSILLRVLSGLPTSWFRQLSGPTSFLPMMSRWRAVFLKFCKSGWALAGLLMFYCGLGWTDKNLDTSRLGVMFAHTPDASSTKTLAHFLQIIYDNEFHAMDLGEADNVKRYGTPTPPHYNLSDIRCPVAMFYGGGDDLLDVEKLAKVVQPVYLQRDEEYIHMDYLWGLDAEKNVYRKVIELIHQHTTVTNA
eukprot:gnl/Hemi2/26149_TR8777_c0_g1_i1.p1 gnl/Hemi2/26149_TR8777_c0_g1~~gnl/Hemi2/26149_TR8777_c0_g1_i1.p1  ORF type:complete len:455 (+),score=142.62 gnl/Hemi2/26149_TR8777_c0_g1_i1:181-1545(+)